MASNASSIAIDRRATALIEFAIVLPVVICLLVGMIGYGQYFLLAHSVQQIANDAARATVGGLSVDERADLARQSVSDDVAAMKTVPASRISTAISETGDTVAVDVTLDAQGMALFRTALVPMPSAQIDRRAVARRGGLS